MASGRYCFVVVFLCTGLPTMANFNAVENGRRQLQNINRVHSDCTQEDKCTSVLCPLGTQCVNKELQCEHEVCPTVAVCEAMKSYPNYCSRNVDAGHCGTGLDHHIQERWFYNTTAAQCQMFQYSGCGGNENNYLTKRQCNRSCVRLEECYLKPESGPCRARFIRYSYDVIEGTCKSFVYGGCRGNDNNFLTFEACMQKCYVPQFDDSEVLP